MGKPTTTTRSLVNPITPPIASIDSIHLHWTGALNNTICAHHIVRSIIIMLSGYNIKQFYYYIIVFVLYSMVCTRFFVV